jgi:hypothetical protein
MEEKARLDEKVEALEIRTAELKKEYAELIQMKERIQIDMN